MNELIILRNNCYYYLLSKINFIQNLLERNLVFQSLRLVFWVEPNFKLKLCNQQFLT
jgi:hypothetical protein